MILTRRERPEAITPPPAAPIALHPRRQGTKPDAFLTMWAKWLFLRWLYEHRLEHGPSVPVSEWQPRHDSVPTGRCASPVHAMYPPHDIASHNR